MKYAILSAPSLLLVCFVVFLSQSVKAPPGATDQAARDAEIKALRHDLDMVAARLTLMEDEGHTFVPRGISAQPIPSVASPQASDSSL